MNEKNINAAERFIYEKITSSMALDPSSFVLSAAEEIKSLVRNDKIISAVSGGVDSAVATAIAWRAVGSSLQVVFLDTGFMREGEPEKVASEYEKLGIKVEIVPASERFYKSLRGISDPEDKRKVFRKEFYSVLSSIAREKKCNFLLQGTIAPDWIETKGGIKTQHNVLEQIGIDPEREFGLRILEPLRNLYKDQVRAIAHYLGLDYFAKRQPFPGPGLLVRVPGALDLGRLSVARKATSIVEGYLQRCSTQCLAAVFSGIKGSVSTPIGEGQLLSEGATGVMGDSRAFGYVISLPMEAYKRETVQKLSPFMAERGITRVLVKLLEKGKGYAVVIRAVLTEDFMTADIPILEKDVLMELAERIAEIDGVGSVHYDITPKPPATIEFE
jgi:GMP synthase (glutamine-hydrolysing)